MHTKVIYSKYQKKVGEGPKKVSFGQRDSFPPVWVGQLGHVIWSWIAHIFEWLCQIISLLFTVLGTITLVQTWLRTFCPETDIQIACLKILLQIYRFKRIHIMDTNGSYIFCNKTAVWVKFIYSEKATKFCEISTVDLTITT